MVTDRCGIDVYGMLQAKKEVKKKMLRVEAADLLTC